MFVLVKLEFRQKIKCQTPDSKGKGTKKGLTGGAKRGKIISTLADTHINPCCY